MEIFVYSMASSIVSHRSYDRNVAVAMKLLVAELRQRHPCLAVPSFRARKTSMESPEEMIGTVQGQGEPSKISPKEQIRVLAPLTR